MDVVNVIASGPISTSLHFHKLELKSVKGNYLMDSYPTICLEVGENVTLFFNNLDEYSKFANQLYAVKKKLEYQTKEKGNK